SRDAATGGLRFLAVMRDRVAGVRGLGGAVSVVVSGDGTSVYVAGREDDSLVVFKRDAVSGKLRFVESERERDFGPTALATAHAGVDAPARLRKPLGVAFSPSGSEVYAAASDPGSLVAFDVSDGELRPVSVHHDAGTDSVAEACAVAISPDGAHVYVA